ncbi:MAG TPA: 50S ribosomal protein L21 [Bacteroidales bacterium]|nr:50S ribosomal protein L21 [Bacteroidales bacterium]
MYAIVEIAGQQFKVEEGKKIFVHRLDAGEGNELKFDRVLLLDDDGKITIGEPVIKDAVIEGKVVDHVRGDKVIVFKKKRKKGYRVKNGHRQDLTQVEIISINGKTSGKKTKKAEAAAEVEADNHEAGEKKASKKASNHKKADEKPSEE